MGSQNIFSEGSGVGHEIVYITFFFKQNKVQKMDNELWQQNFLSFRI